MRSHYIAKLLLSQSTHSKGGMLIRLLALGGLTGLGASIASSSAYSQQHLVGQFEARRYIGIINSAQKNYYLRNQRFASKLDDLKTQVPGQTNYYTYEVSWASKLSASTIRLFGSKYEEGAFVSTLARPLPNRLDLKTVYGETLMLHEAEHQFAFISKRCESIVPLAPSDPIGGLSVSVTPKSGEVSCPKGFRELKEHQ